MTIPGNLLSSNTESMDPTIWGWTPKLNCTLSKGTGGRNGDGCLAAKSSAAGDMQARTVSAYPVTAGTTYYAFSDTSGTVGERIGIRWLNSSGTEVSVTWSVTTTGSSTSWHRVSVAGVAPAAAAQAQVLLSSTETAAGVIHYWENVYFGLPIRTTGNLLNFNAESSEVDSSGWAAVVNATVSRQVPVIGWAVDNYLAGGHTLAVTAVAAGNASVLAVDRPAVTPGVDYLAYAYLQPPTLASTAWIELRFYDINGNQIFAARSVLAPPGTGMYRQRASAVAPPAAATCSVAAGLDGASAGQVLRLETVVVTTAPKLAAGSVLSYAASSFEMAGSSGWNTVSGVAALARTTPWGSSFFEGAYALAVTSATATASTIRSPLFSGVVAGQNHRVQVIARQAAGAWASVWVRIRWYDAANADLGASTGIVYVIPGTSWYALPVDATAPAGAVQAAVELTLSATAAGSVLHVDQATLRQVLPLTEVSASDADGFVTLTLRDLNVDYELTVYREQQDGSRTLVRSTSGLIDHQLITSDLMVIEDHEAPLNTPVRYQIAQNPVGSLVAGGRISDYVTVNLSDINEAWLKDPGNPQRNLRVLVEKAPDWQRPVDQATFVIRGRRNKVTLSGLRQGLEGDLAITTRSDEERKALHLLLDSGNVLLWQAVPGMGVEDMYVTVGQITEARMGALAQDQWRQWMLPLTQTDMPLTTVLNGAAGRTWQDVLTEFATWQDVLNAYATWEDVLLDKRKG